MSYIFMDESGDLGFNFAKRGTSKFFVVTLLYTNTKKALEKLVNQIHSDLRVKYSQTRNCLHAQRESSQTRIKLLKKLAEYDVQVFYIAVDKFKLKNLGRANKSDFYNFVTRLLLDHIAEKGHITSSDVDLIVSRRETSRYLNERFKKWVSEIGEHKKRINLNISVSMPYEEKCLQIVDFVCWSVFRKFEYEDNIYLDLIKEKISVAHNYLG